MYNYEYICALYTYFIDVITDFTVPRTQILQINQVIDNGIIPDQDNTTMSDSQNHVRNYFQGLYFLRGRVNDGLVLVISIQ